MNKTTLFLFLDGLRWDYLDRMPYLRSLSNEGIYVKQLRPVSGFQQDLPMFSGVYPNKSNIWFALKFADSDSPYEYLNTTFYKYMSFIYNMRKMLPTKYAKKLLRLIILSKIIKAGGYKYMRYPRFMPNAPLKLMPYFDITTDKEIGSWCPGAFNDFESIFDLCFKADKKVNYCAAPVFSRFMNIMLPRIKNDLDTHYDFSVYQITDLDHKVHEMGPDSPKLNNLLKIIDNGSKEIIGLFKNKYKNVNVLICGDHGMAKVEKYIDAQGELLDFAKKNDLKLYRDFIYIIDSTHLRVKSLSNKMKIKSKDLLKISFFNENGFFINEELICEYNLPQNKDYGDIIWEVDHNSIIQPNFYNDSMIYDTLGMHGYLPRYPDIFSTAIVIGEGISHKKIDIGEMVDIFPLLCNLLGFDIPKTNQGMDYINNP